MSVPHVVISGAVSLDTPVTISLTMTLGNWKHARNQLAQGDSDRYEASKMLRAIQVAIGAMEARFEVPLAQELPP